MCSLCQSGVENVEIHHVDTVKSSQSRNICAPGMSWKAGEPTNNKFVKYRLAWPGCETEWSLETWE